MYKQIAFSFLFSIIAHFFWVDNLFSNKETEETEEDFKKPLELLKLVENFHINTQSFKGEFSILKNDVEIHSGIFFFKNPEFLKLIFNNKKNPSKIIISDGKILWIYIPQKNLIIDQDLSNNYKLSIENNLYPHLKKILIPGYFQFENQKIKKEKLAPYKNALYILNIQTKTEYFGFRRISLHINEEGMILYNKIYYPSNENLAFQKKKLTKINLAKEIFERPFILGTKTLKNPFNYLIP